MQTENAMSTEKRSPRKEDPLAEEERARGYMLRALTASPRSRSQLAQGLAQRDVEPELAERLLDRFVEVGLVDDSVYAHTLARTRFAERGLARRAIGAELRRKGINDVDAESALMQIDDSDEQEAAHAYVKKRLARMTGLDRNTTYRRLMGALGRRGYSSGLAMRVISEELSTLGLGGQEFDVDQG